MSDEEDDYMSDKFLTGLQDVRPSLLNNRAKKRQIEDETKEKNIKKQKELKKQKSGDVDNESLQAALNIPLAQENKGFRLLSKMGYKPGQALGKHVENKNSSSSNNFGRLTEPIGITIKTDRQGLGREAALQELKERRHRIRQQRMKKELGGEMSIEEFRRRSNQKHEEKFVLYAIRRCQVTCENLDIESNIEVPPLPWFWPERTKETNDDVNKGQSIEDGKEENVEEDVEEFSSQEKLELLTNYVRTSYLFCYWCGVRYNDERDLEDNCPGLTKNDH